LNRNDGWSAVCWISIATLLGCLAPLAMAADSPAQLMVGERSIEAMLRLPGDLARGRYAVHCEAYIMRTGRAEQAYCYTLEGPAPDDLVFSVSEAATRARFVPAMRKGESIHVHVVFMVLIDTTLHEPMILAVPNNGAERQKYGLLYTAPQRVSNTPSRNIPSRTFVQRRPYQFVLMQFQIDAHGKVTNFELHDVTGKNGSVLWRSERRAREFEFLPGYHEGRPVPMLYVEPDFTIDE
jgi:hypothetical protein